MKDYNPDPLIARANTIKRKKRKTLRLNTKVQTKFSDSNLKDLIKKDSIEIIKEEEEKEIMSKRSLGLSKNSLESNSRRTSKASEHAEQINLIQNQ